MPFVTTGLANGGVTTHYRFSYDQSLAAPAGPEPARTNAVIAACEQDYNLMSGWFGGGAERHRNDGPGDDGERRGRMEPAAPWRQRSSSSRHRGQL